jgi:hypothetical protein
MGKDWTHERQNRHRQWGEARGDRYTDFCAGLVAFYVRHLGRDRRVGLQAL